MKVRTALLAVAAAASAAHAQGTFIIRRGADTLAVEQFTREAGLLTGAVTQKSGLRSEYVAVLKPDNSVERIDMTRKAAQPITIGIGFDAQAVNVSFAQGGQSENASIATPSGKAAPFLALSLALSEQIVKAANLKPNESVKWLMLRLGSGDTATATITRYHADSVSITMPDVGLKLAINARGEVVGGTHQSQPWIVERKP
jgi:hypothetical protein